MLLLMIIWGVTSKRDSLILKINKLRSCAYKNVYKIGKHTVPHIKMTFSYLVLLSYQIKEGWSNMKKITWLCVFDCETVQFYEPPYEYPYHNPTEILIEFQWGSFFIPICNIRAFRLRNRENLPRYSALEQIFCQYLSPFGCGNRENVGGIVLLWQ